VLRIKISTRVIGLYSRYTFVNVKKLLRLKVFIVHGVAYYTLPMFGKKGISGEARNTCFFNVRPSASRSSKTEVSISTKRDMVDLNEILIYFGGPTKLSFTNIF